MAAAGVSRVVVQGPNRAIPSEAQLVGEYGIARATVRRAIAVLVDQGALFVVPQRGTFVKPEGE